MLNLSVPPSKVKISTSPKSPKTQSRIVISTGGLRNQLRDIRSENACLANELQTLAAQYESMKNYELTPQEMEEKEVLENLNRELDQEISEVDRQLEEKRKELKDLRQAQTNPEKYEKLKKLSLIKKQLLKEKKNKLGKKNDELHEQTEKEYNQLHIKMIGLSIEIDKYRASIQNIQGILEKQKSKSILQPDPEYEQKKIELFKQIERETQELVKLQNRYQIAQNVVSIRSPTRYRELMNQKMI